MAGVYSDTDPPRKTMRRGVLMTLLQQSAMTLPLWIGKPGERYLSFLDFLLHSQIHISQFIFLWLLQSSTTMWCYTSKQ